MTSLHSDDELYGLLAAVLRVGRDRLTPGLAIHTIDTWNSLTHIELVVSIEEKFGLQLTEDEIAEMTSIAVIMRVLRDRGVLAAEAKRV
jgi:acyl carrier protein